jgi:hypothetical protein
MTPYEHLVAAVTERYAAHSTRRRVAMALRRLEKLHADLAEVEGLLHDVHAASAVVDDVYEHNAHEARESLEALMENLRAQFQGG